MGAADAALSRGELVAAIAREIVAAPAPGRRRVAVDGVDGAGKSVFAAELAAALRALGETVVHASVDGFHRPREQRYVRGRDSPEGFFLDSYDYESFRSLLLDPFGPDGDGRYTAAVYDVEDEQPVERRQLAAPPGAILVVDGIFLHRAELAGCWDYSIWLEVPFEVSVARCSARGAFTSADPDDAGNRRYVEGQRLYIDSRRPRERATAVVDNTILDVPTRIPGIDEVALFVTRRDGREVLVMHRSPLQGSYWHVVAGGVEPGETALEAAVRELREETGLVAQPEDGLDVTEYAYRLDEEQPAAPGPDSFEVNVRCFRVTAPDGWEPTLDWEHDGHRWCTPAEAVELLRWPETRNVLARLLGP